MGLHYVKCNHRLKYNCRLPGYSLTINCRETRETIRIDLCCITYKSLLSMNFIFTCNEIEIIMQAFICCVSGIHGDNVVIMNIGYTGVGSRHVPRYIGRVGCLGLSLIRTYLPYPGPFYEYYVPKFFWV